MAAPVRSESVGLLHKQRFIDCLQKHLRYFLYEFVICGRNSQWPFFLWVSFFGDIFSSCSFWSILLRLDFLYESLYPPFTHAIQGLSVCSRCHAARRLRDFIIGQPVEFRVAEVPVQSPVLIPCFVCVLRQAAKYIFRISHDASRTVLFLHLLIDLPPFAL